MVQSVNHSAELSGVLEMLCSRGQQNSVLLPGVCLGMGVFHLTAKLGRVARGVFGYGCVSPDSKTLYCCQGCVWVWVCFT